MCFGWCTRILGNRKIKANRYLTFFVSSHFLYLSIYLIRSFYMLLCVEYNYVFIKLTSLCTCVYNYVCDDELSAVCKKKTIKIFPFNTIILFRSISIYLILAVMWGLHRKKKKKKDCSSFHFDESKDNKWRWCKSLFYIRVYSINFWHKYEVLCAIQNVKSNESNTYVSNNKFYEFWDNIELESDNGQSSSTESRKWDR